MCVSRKDDEAELKAISQAALLQKSPISMSPPQRTSVQSILEEGPRLERRQTASNHVTVAREGCSLGDDRAWEDLLCRGQRHESTGGCDEVGGDGDELHCIVVEDVVLGGLER